MTGHKNITTGYNFGLSKTLQRWFINLYLADSKQYVSEIKDFSDAHIGCTNSKTMHPAKYL